ncbi:hypothetical protein BX600DRAFT_454954 [Xylariales sp. PMI_506]|nr:hypothetical protein BX600DRAFT_454954 [Xylariales sp. PMI_506]
MSDQDPAAAPAAQSSQYPDPGVVDDASVDQVPAQDEQQQQPILQPPQDQQEQHQQHPDSPSQQLHHHHHQHDQLPLHYDDGIPSMPATAVAHHGLQALEAATAATHTPLAQQYAQSAAMHVTADGQYAPLPPSPISNSAVGAPHGAVVGLGSPATPSSQKVTRLRRACDMCSQRKVKCDESGPPCKPCSDLNVECTFNREMKRRGPPNKHAEAAKRARLGDALASNPQNAAETLVSIAGNDGTAGLDAETIAPWPVLTLLIDDFFTYMHPLMPFPHEPTFRQAFEARADKTNRDFLALVASMIAILVASFPRSARAHLKASHSTNLFPTAVTMVDRCRLVAMEARGATYMAKDELTVDDAATSYFLGVSAAYTLQWKACKRHLAETMTFCREIVINRRTDTPPLATDSPSLAAVLNAAAAEKQTDHIRDQIGKRIFWVMVAGLRSMTQLGASINEIPLPPPTNQEPYPDLPLEVDDEYIYSHQILGQPANTMSLITGFNRNISTYMAMNELVGVDMCYGINFFEWGAQKSMLSNAIQSTKTTLDQLPLELQVKIEKSQPETFGSAIADVPGLQYYPPAFPATQPPNDVRHIFVQDPTKRRRLQLEIQKANIYASQLATRSYFVERYLNLRDIHRQANFTDEDVKDEIDEMVYNERELIVRNLLSVLTSITQRNMEPNGASLVNKIRQVASTLLNDAPERKGPVAVKAEEYLGKFLEILVNLEKISAGNTTGTMTPRDEDEELQHWASLRDYQAQFSTSDALLSE